MPQLQRLGVMIGAGGAGSRWRDRMLRMTSAE
jgi:hypothetical protein